MHIISLKKGREASLLRHHPWVFSGAIARVSGEPAPGETVQVRDHGGNILALAAWSPQSQIRARVWSFSGAETVINADFIRQRIQRAVGRRDVLMGEERTAVRLIYGESDGLPGLVVDRYGDYLSCQILSTGAEYWRQTIVEALAELTSCRGIYERSDAGARKHEGLPLQTGLLFGQEPPDFITIREHDRFFDVNLQTGHKTGYYLDQFDNRNRVQQLCTRRPGMRVLNCFSYTGGFGIAALKGGANYVVNVDSSGPALELAGRNLELNGFETAQAELVQADVFDYLRTLHRQSVFFDMVVLDPPKFADTRHQVKKAARAYKDVAMQAAKLLAPGGLLVSFSCSGGIDPALFQKITADALLDAGRNGRIMHYLRQAEDHPVALPFPEALYLKGLVCEVD